MSALAFNDQNGQLEVVPTFWAPLDVFPSDVVWRIVRGQVVSAVAAASLGVWVFPRPTSTPTILAAPGLVGWRLVSFNAGVDYNLLDQSPAQVLALFARP